MAYRFLYDVVLRWIPAEAAHSIAVALARLAVAIPGVRMALRRRLQPRDRSLEVVAFGRTFPSPLGVAGGLDKGATWFECLGALGFAFVEVGTVTALAQPGNSGKRIWRLTADRALLNRMGFPNPGAAAVAGRLRRARRDTIVAANVGKSKVVPLEEAGGDYRATVRALAPLADFVVVNVSSPNTPGLRQMQAIEPLRALIAEVQDELRALTPPVPLLLKIAPDLGDAEIDAIADLAVEVELDGIVATNTTVHRQGLSVDPARVSAEGGISGAPLKARSLEVLRLLHARVEGRIVLVSVGGIETADDVWERIAAGATLVQAYTGFVYGGPLWPSRVNRELERRLRASGYESLADLSASRGVMR